ncbi:hypothetical protein M9H77_02716 [Catharanthus roseus]|uniref:Uncharacterized protein n=1 Tax=Catharanthus roseus TaxID=4058 RepID=A0ACC0C934_CATRO|nr:hypothetical protein M9H77_02716 [Catharanthus roseus]
MNENDLKQRENDRKRHKNSAGSSLPCTVGHPIGRGRHLVKGQMGDRRSLLRMVGSPYRPSEFEDRNNVFELRESNSRDELRRGSKEKSMDTNEAMEARLATIFEQWVEKMAMSQDNWQGYNTYSNKYSSSWINQPDVP